MTQILLFTLFIALAVGVLSAVILFVIARKFHVEEDPRIDDVTGVLPGANCGGCGYAGCRNFAEACVKSASLDGLFCPVGGNDTMAQVAKVLGREAVARVPMIAVVRCQGSLKNRPRQSHYDGPHVCAVAHTLYKGETGCQDGCLGLGDCVRVCKFGAIVVDSATHLPVVSDDKCVACGACVTACPRKIIELRLKGPQGRRVHVSCVNQDKGNVAMKHCKAACIACGRCVKECPFGAIQMVNFLSYIDAEKCKLCRKCVAVCPTHAIEERNFPLRIDSAAKG
jgi:Na+-translocating ferredoxin:NAD+ oxidoreductase RNF subunit RnfB